MKVNASVVSSENVVAGNKLHKLHAQPHFNPLTQTNPGFHVSAVQVFRKQYGKRIVRSNFSFSHYVFYQFGELSAIFIKYEIVVCKLFQIRRV